MENELTKLKRLAGINLTEADIKDAIFEKTMKKIEQMTNRNDHNGARILGAKFLKSKYFIDVFSAIEMIADAEGHISKDVDNVSKRFDKEMWKHAEKILPPEQAKRFKGAF